VDATFAAFGIDAVYTPAGGEPMSVRVIARRPDTIVGFGETLAADATESVYSPDRRQGLDADQDVGPRAGGGDRHPCRRAVGL
jgi:hypothetical protein